MTTPFLFRHATLFALCSLLVLTGAGCGSKPKVQPPLPPDALSKPPEQQEARWIFQPNDALDVRVGLGEGAPMRRVTFTRFNPKTVADFTWANVTSSANKVALSGTIEEVGLRGAHVWLMPSVWKKGSASLIQEKSAMWLSDDAFLELANTKRTNVDIGLRDAGVASLANGAATRAIYATLAQKAADELKRRDPNVVMEDATIATKTIKVNGKDAEVPVIRARNWYGTFEVLQVRQNPLVLSFTLDPDATSGINKTSKEFLALRDLVSFEVTSLLLYGR
ncbi:MAG: hypothetical protein WCV84_00105 [Patescibacteria group bacterium]